MIRDILIYFAIKYNGEWQKIFDAIKNKESIDDEEILKQVEKVKNQSITLIDEDYPERLKNVFKPPFVLFYKGDKSLLKGNIVSIVGSRLASEYGKRATKSIVTDLKGKNMITCSGLAKGIDGVVHKVSLEENIPTIAVLTSGIDYCYPKENLSLYLEIQKRGLIISEYPFKTHLLREQIPFRNRIIAALGDNLIVTEAYPQSGTLISVRYALECGKDIYAVPYPFDSESICNKLINDGAYLICRGDDIFKKI